MPRRLIPDTKEGRIIMGGMLLCMVLVLVLAWVLVSIPRPASGADLMTVRLRQGRTMDAINAGRWREMCKGPARYDAMREAYELRMPDPCNGAKKWVR